MTIEEWKKKNNFRHFVGCCYHCKHHLFIYNEEVGTCVYECTRLNRSIGKHTTLTKSIDSAVEMVCDSFREWEEK